jgi:hypothetical protein
MFSVGGVGVVMVKRQSAKSPKSKAKVEIHIRFPQETLEMLRLGGAYHQVGYQTYLRWLVEQGLKEELTYYGWVKVPKRSPRAPDPESERLTRKRILRLMAKSERKAKNAPPSKA